MTRVPGIARRPAAGLAAAGHGCGVRPPACSSCRRPAAAGGAAGGLTLFLTSCYVNPQRLAVHGTQILVTDGDRLTVVGRSMALAAGPLGGDVTGVALDAAGTTYAYASSTANHADTRLTIVGPDGRRVTASLSAYERAHNPDRTITYGVPRPSACVRKAFKALDGGPAGYAGRVDSHPVAVAGAGTTWFVADAGANAVLRVDAAGTVSLVNVLPHQPFRFSSQTVRALGLPSCVVGATYYAEAVPTDLDVGPGATSTSRPGPGSTTSAKPAACTA